MSTASVSYGQVPENLKDCMSISVAIERLSCFDREMEALTAGLDTQETESAPGRQTAAAAESSGAASAVEPAASTSQPGAETQARKSQAVPERADSPPAEAFDDAQAPDALEASVEEFSSQRQEREEPVRELTGVVSSVSNRARGEHVIELENGQVWQENFASRYLPLEPGDEVTIRKRRFGGYRLVTPSGKGYGVKRVR